jgi:putative toxin-antitoxin system antitoxin component (TIGR02293 family)
MAKTMTRKNSLTGFSESPGADFLAEPATRVDATVLAELSRHGYSDDEIFVLVVPKRTLARRKAANEPLTVEETDKALRLERIAVQAEHVFGDPDKAHRWLRKAKRELRGETPLAYLASEAGARVVEEMLFRIEHGIFG